MFKDMDNVAFPRFKEMWAIYNKCNAYLIEVTLNFKPPQPTHDLI